MRKEFVDILNNHRGLIYKVCHLYCDDPEDRKDLFQEIVIQLWNAYPKFRGESKFSTWLYRVAINTAITGLRKKKDLIDSKEPDQLPELVDEENESNEEKLSHLYKAIGQLSQVEKAIVMLYMEDRSYEEMEEILGMSQGNLRVKMNRIKEKLRQLTKIIDHGTGRP